jgi:type II secretory ATPase GspE/PulE/Tfp pilus assembly ATPase PilB-like protein
MANETKTYLGQILVEKKIISQEQLDQALRKQKETGEMLGTTLLKLGFVSEEAIFIPIIADQWGVEHINLRAIDITQDVISKIPAKFAIHYKILPFQMKDQVLWIATTNPLDIHLYDEVSLIVNNPLKFILASEKDILEGIKKYYGLGAETIEGMMGSRVAEKGDEFSNVTDLDEPGSEASISKFLNQILLEAYHNRASDIHVEPYEEELKIRYRVDGVLFDAKVSSNIKHFKDAINSRIKILSNLNIAEKRLPQDGRFKVRVKDIDLDLRVSFLPTPYGESVVLRVLNTTRLYNLSDLGIPDKERKLLEGLIKKPHGIIFLTGPTGSGKTTTLYSCLSQVNTEDKKIITIEDPVEYQLQGITQIQINPKIGLTFANGLRSMLRHDPDIMMVGEVRDRETAEVAIQVSLTGHLVFSTLHTNDAASGVTRLLDMGIDPYLVTSTVECFIAQRLLRLICPKCKVLKPISADMLEEFKGYANVAHDTKIYEGKGCEECKFSGYAGRKAIYEILLFNEQIRQLIMEHATASQIKEKAVSLGMKTLRQAGWDKVLEGLTTPEEVIRVTKEEN